LAGYKQGVDLEPDSGLVLEVLKRLKNGRELARTESLVETLCEAFEVDVGGIHVPKEFGPRLRRDVACAHRHRLDPPLTAGLRHVNCIFQKDHRVVVSKCNGPATASHRRFCNSLG